MTVAVASYPLGTPRAAMSRGGDCRAIDLHEGRNVYGPHRFASTDHCALSNGMLRLDLGPTGVAPAFAMTAWKAAGGIGGDIYSDIYSDIYGGTILPGEWFGAGTLTVDTPSASALLTGVRLIRCNPEIVTVRLVCPLIGDAFVSLRRGEPMCRIQHGRTRVPVVTTTRRVRITDTPDPTGTATAARVVETVPEYPRFVASITAATGDGSLFSLTTTSLGSAKFGVGVGTAGTNNSAASLHGQLCDASTQMLAVAV